MTNIEYTGFWSGFHNDPHNPLQQFFEGLFEGVGGEIRVHSVFGPGPDAAAGTRLLVSYSGEPYHHDPALFHLSLIMQPDDTGIVCLPLFSVTSYERDYWPRYMEPRALSVPKTRFCAFVVSNPNAPLRNMFFERLSEYKRVDSCGQALNNYGSCAPHDPPEYLGFLHRFKFMICFENTALPCYLTEKLHNAWLGGTIPIYWGASKSLEWLNPRAFLYLEEGASDGAISRLIDRVVELDNDDAKYMEVFREPLLLGHRIPDVMEFGNIRERVIQGVAMGNRSRCG